MLSLIVFPHVGNHTVAVIKGHEDYNLLKMSCSKVFDDINKLVRAGKIRIGDKDVPIEIFVGGDYKVIMCTISTTLAQCMGTHINSEFHKISA